MGSKGESKRTKAISVSKAVHVSRKESFWTIRAKAGPHSRDSSLALGIAVRDFIGITKTLRETKNVLNQGEVKVNGKARKEHQFPIGLFDVISIAKQKLFFRVAFDSKERLILKPLEKESNEKICKVVKKVMMKKGVQITTDDGRTFIGTNANLGDSIKLKLPEGKVEGVIEFKAGALAYIVKGAHCAEIATIKEIVPATQRRDKLVKLASKKEEFETVSGNVYIIGKDKAEIEGLN